MPNFEVTITQQVRRAFTIDVEAADKEDAKEKAFDILHNDGIYPYEKVYDCDTYVRELEVVK